MKIAKIISGGQTGADRGGLEAAIYFGLPYGGYVPKGRKSEDGTVPDKYVGIVETNSSDYRVRTEMNIQDSDVTIVFCHGEPTGGSKLTFEFCVKLNKCWMAVDLNQSFSDNLYTICNTLDRYSDDLVINVAGSRESKSKGIQNEVEKLMTAVIAKMNMIGGAV